MLKKLVEEFNVNSIKGEGTSKPSIYNVIPSTNFLIFGDFLQTRVEDSIGDSFKKKIIIIIIKEETIDDDSISGARFKLWLGD